MDRRIEREVVPACERFELDVLPYFPLASGLLTGKYQRGTEPASGTRLASFGERGQRAMSDENFDKLDKLIAFADQAGRTILQLAMSWLAAHSFVPSVIAGATSAQQVAQNAAAIDWQLSADEMAEVATLSH
jgi:aryl-alcohol dehydrogenase-like predicted oxidoreductase